VFEAEKEEENEINLVLDSLKFRLRFFVSPHAPACALKVIIIVKGIIEYITIPQ
jgi:hypothetical protein